MFKRNVKILAVLAALAAPVFMAAPSNAAPAMGAVAGFSDAAANTTAGKGLVTKVRRVCSTRWRRRCRPRRVCNWRRGHRVCRVRRTCRPVRIRRCWWR